MKILLSSLAYLVMIFGFLSFAISPASAKWVTSKKIIDDFTDAANVKILLLSFSSVKDQFVQVQCFQDPLFQGILISVGEFLASSEKTVSARMRFDKKEAFSADLTISGGGNSVLITPKQAIEYDFINNMKNAKKFLIELTPPSGQTYEKAFGVKGFTKAYNKVRNDCDSIFQ